METNSRRPYLWISDDGGLNWSPDGVVTQSDLNNLGISDSYVKSFSGPEDADNAPTGLRKGMNVNGKPAKFNEWVLYETFYYDDAHTFGWQRAQSMSSNDLAIRYKRNNTWSDWGYLVLES